MYKRAVSEKQGSSSLEDNLALDATDMAGRNVNLVDVESQVAVMMNDLFLDRRSISRDHDRAKPGMSRQAQGNWMHSAEDDEDADHAEQLIKEAEQVKAQIFGPSGGLSEGFKQMIHTPSAEADEDFLLVSSHIESSTKQKIERGEYVDFAKLIVCDHLGHDEERRMELVMKGNQTYWVPVNAQMWSSAVSISGSRPLEFFLIYM